MSLPNYKMTLLALSLGLATAVAGCSSNPKKEVVDTGPKSSEQVYMEKAEKALNRKQYSDAARSLEAIDTYYPTGQYAQQAQLELLYVKFQQKDYEAAITQAERFIRLNPQHPNVDYAYYVRGVSNMELNYDSLLRYTSLQQSHRDVSYLKLAYQNFVDFIRRFPSSEYAVDAAQRMKYIQQELAESEINVARFNIKRKAWVAAAERSQWVVEHYPQTPQVPEALATLSYAYEQLGDQATSAQYAEILKLNYPDLVRSNGSVNLRAARNDGSWWNRATLGILGRGAKTTGTQQDDVEPITPASAPRSWTNRLSFGMLDKPEAQSNTATNNAQIPNLPTNTAHPEPESTVTVPSAADQQRSWTNRLSFGLLDRPEPHQTEPLAAPVSGASAQGVVTAEPVITDPINEPDAAN